MKEQKLKKHIEKLEKTHFLGETPKKTALSHPEVVGIWHIMSHSPISYETPVRTSIWEVLNTGDPQVTIAFNAKKISHLGYIMIYVYIYIYLI